MERGTLGGQRAEGLLSQGEADASLRGRVAGLLEQLVREQLAAVDKARRLVADRALLVELELIRVNRVDLVDWKQTDSEYAAAFRKAGLDLDETGAAISGRWLAARSESQELVGYLDDWAYVRRAEKRPEADWRRLVDAARAADRDPWRDALRAKAGTKDELAIAEFQRLADDEKSLDAQPATSLVLLAIQLKVAVGDRERAARVLRRAVSRHPSDFWAQRTLGMVHGVDVGAVDKVFPRPVESVSHLTAAVAIRPASPMAHTTLGFALQAQGDFDQAPIELHEALRLKPDELWIHYALGNILRDQKKIPEAFVEYREAVRLMPGNPVALYCLGNALRDEGHLEESFAEFREAIRLAPNDPIPHYGLGLAHRKKGESEAAIAEFREAVRLDGNQLGSAIVDLASLLVELGRFEEAEAAYRERIRIDPTEAWVYQNLADVLNAQGKPDEAVASYREAIRRGLHEAYLHYGLAGTLKARGNMDEAFAEYREAIRIKPGDAMAHWLYGLALRDQGKPGDAIIEFREAAHLQPDNESIHSDLMALSGPRPIPTDDGVKSLREAIRIKADDANAHHRLASALKAQGHLEEAIAEFRETIHLEGKNAGVSIGELGSILVGLKRFEEAETIYREATRFKPREAWIHYGLAEALNAQGKVDAALIAFREAIRLAPGEAYFHYGLANALKGRGSMDEAFAEYREAIRLKPGDAVAHWLYGLTLRDQGKPGDAIIELREAARLQPENESIHTDLMALMGGRDNPAENAVEILREAIRLKSDDAMSHYRLGLAWKSRDKPDDALSELREAVRLKPDDYDMKASLSALLVEQGAWDELVKFSRQAVERNPDDPSSMHRLAVALIRSGDRGGYRRATFSTVARFARSEDKLVSEAARACFLDPDPGDDLAIPGRLAEFAFQRDSRASWWRYVSGLGLYRAGEFRRAIDRLDRSGMVDPTWDAFQLNWPVLAMAHHRLGDDREAKEWLRKAREVRGDRALGLAPTLIPVWHDREEFLILLRQAEVLIEGRSSDPASLLPAFLRGEHPTRDPVEIARLAYAAFDEGLYARSARLFADAFAADPKLAVVSHAENRTHAARSAVLAAAGRGRDEPAPNMDERTSLRHQALGWLRAELNWMAGLVEAGADDDRATVSRSLLHWREVIPFASLRDPDALAKLPEAEGEAWRKLWSDAEILSKPAESKGK